MRTRPFQHFAAKDGRVPDVRDLEAGNQLKCLRPVRSCVPGDGGLVVARGTVLHVARLGGTVAVQAGPVAPF